MSDSEREQTTAETIEAYIRSKVDDDPDLAETLIRFMGGASDMVLVPRIPTPDMLEAGRWAEVHDENAASVWRDMIEEWERAKQTTILRHPVTNQDVEVDTRTGRIVGRKDQPDIVAVLRENPQAGPLGQHMLRAADEIERLREEIAGLKIELGGAAHNRFYDQRDAYFEGIEDGR